MKKSLGGIDNTKDMMHQSRGTKKTMGLKGWKYSSTVWKRKPACGVELLFGQNHTTTTQHSPRNVRGFTSNPWFFHLIRHTAWVILVLGVINQPSNMLHGSVMKCKRVNQT